MNFDWWSKKDIKQGYNTDWRSQVTHTHTGKPNSRPWNGNEART